ncbi:MAG: hypothetical protein ABIZ56_01480 [Chthoniobacteraceae bacterium]
MRTGLLRSFAVGDNSGATNHSLVAGQKNNANNFSLTGGRGNEADDRSAALGFFRNATVYSFTLGSANTASNFSASCGSTKVLREFWSFERSPPVDVTSLFDKTLPTDSWDAHKYHSGQYRSTNMKRWRFWDGMLDEFGLRTN